MYTARASTLFECQVVVEEVAPLPASVTLFPEEEHAVGKAGFKRRREFAAGRYCARRALARLGIHDVALPANADRTPSWPAEVVGSIAHTDRYCIAAVALRTSLLAVGVDAEPDEPLETELWSVICTPHEQRWLANRSVCERGRLARLIFSAKESVYKAQYPLTGTVLEFHDVGLDIEPELGRFTATLLRDAGEGFFAGTRIAGRFGSLAGTLVTAVELRLR